MSNTEMSLELKGFKDWILLYRNPKPSTLRGHMYRVKLLLKELGDKNLDLSFCVNFLSGLKQKGGSQSYLRNFTKSITVFVEYESSVGSCEDFRKQLPKFKVGPTEIKVLSVEDVKKILECEGKYQEIIELLARTGRRVNEATSLKVKHFDKSRSAILLENPKNGIPTWVPVPEDLGEKISSLCELRSPEAYIFPNSNSGHIADQIVNRELKRRAVKCGIKANVHAHLLRHSFATHLLESDKVGIDKVSRLLTHSDIRTTMKYNHILIGALKTAMNAHELNKGNMSREDVKMACEKAYGVLHGHLPEWVTTNILESDEEIVIKIKIPQNISEST